MHSRPGSAARDGLTFPVNLACAVLHEGRQAWLDSLPRTIEDVARRWKLAVGEPFQPGGATAWVAPAASREGKDLVLKMAWAHPEAAHEAAGLRLWAGNGAVIVHAVEDLGETVALLLERCQPGVPLSSMPEDLQDRVIARLLGRLWREPPADHPFRPLLEMCEQWTAAFTACAAHVPPPLDSRLLRAGIESFRSLPKTAAGHVVLCTDLHAGNALAARRQPWLMIDPKPYVGDPTYDLLQHMLNCPGRLHTNPTALCDRMAALTGMDPDRTRLWLFARCVVESAGWPQLADVARQLAPS